MEPTFIDIHIHTSENPNSLREQYDVKTLLEKINNVAGENPKLISLSDHNTINKSAYMALKHEEVNAIFGVELHIKKYDDAPPYHCHMLFNCEVNEENADRINQILDKIYENKTVSSDDTNIPNIEKISNEFDEFEYMLLPHGGQSHKTFDKATSPGRRFDTIMERSIYFNHFDGFTARSNRGLQDTLDYFKRIGIDEFVNLITCTDNYIPEKYPESKAREAEEFIPTWMLAEPTYDGLRLALSEKSRLSYGYTPPDKWNCSIGTIKLENESCDIDVELTPGLNVVIGGSSSGKTLFVDSLVRGITHKFEGGNYSSFKIDDIEVMNPSGIIPHYVSQNFIISILKSENAKLEEIDIIADVFPEEISSKELVSRSLGELKEIIEKLVESARQVIEHKDMLGHIQAPSHLIEKKNNFKDLLSIIVPNDNELSLLRLSPAKYDKYKGTLTEIEDFFNNSPIDINISEEISIIISGLTYLYGISQYSDASNEAINEIRSKTKLALNAEDRENATKIQQRESLIKELTSCLKAMKMFYTARMTLEKYELKVRTKEVKANGHTLSIENTYNVEAKVLVGIINEFLKIESRINSIEELVPDVLHMDNYSLRPKVKGYDDLAEKIYTSLKDLNKRSYKIVTREGENFHMLSPGWKAAVILDLILAYEQDVAPLIIDQPEDNLATDYINHGLVEQIMKIKPQKQVVLVSHNATIPMLGDAQNVVVCTNDRGRIVIRSAPLEGTINGKKILDYIAEITDGGKPSIKKRVKKYDLKRM